MSQGNPHDAPDDKNANAPANESVYLHFDGQRFAAKADGSTTMGDFLNENPLMLQIVTQLFTELDNADSSLKTSVEQLDDSLALFRAASQKLHEIARRNRDRAPKYITPEHVAIALGVIDWSSFIVVQDTRLDGGDTQLLDAIGAALTDQTPAGRKLRESIARELLYLAWASVAEMMGLALADFDHDSETGDAVTRTLAHDHLKPGGWGDLSRRYLERDILEGFWADYQSAMLPAPPNYAPAFRDGIGNYQTHAVTYGASQAQFKPWRESHDGSPEFEHVWGKNSVARYRIDADAAPSVEAAWDVVKRLDDRHADVLAYVEAKWIANRDAAGNGLHLTASEILDALGFKKQTAGGHKSENVEMIADIIRDLERQTVETRFECYPSGKKKPEIVAIESKLVLVSTSAARVTLDGKKRRYAWYIRPGDWATQIHELQPQYGVLLLAVLQLNPQSDYIAKRIGRYLLHNWRERFASDDLTRPYRISDVLDKAGVPIDRAKAGRFRTRVEAAFDVLRETGVLQNWTYGADVPKPEGHWLAGWLDCGVTVTPHPAVLARKQAFPSRRRGGTKALDKGAAVPGKAI